MTFPPLFRPPRASGLSFSYIDRAVDTANQSSYTLTPTWGSDAPGQKLLLGICTGSYAPTSVTVGGNSATQLATVDNTSEWARWYQYEGNSWDIAVSLGGTTAYCAVVAYRVLGAASAAADTGSDSTGNPSSTTIDVPAGGALFGLALQRSNSSVTFSWTGPDEANGFDDTLEASVSYWSAAAKKYDTTQTGLTVEALSSGAGVRDPIMTLVSFAQAT